MSENHAVTMIELYHIIQEPITAMTDYDRCSIMHHWSVSHADHIVFCHIRHRHGGDGGRETTWRASCSFSRVVMSSDVRYAVWDASAAFQTRYALVEISSLIERSPSCFDRSSVSAIHFNSNRFCQSSWNQLGFPASFIQATTFGGKSDKSGMCMHILS